MFIEFPKYKYHESRAPFVVQNKEEEAQLGDDWVDSPAYFGADSHPSAQSVLSPLQEKQEAKPKKLSKVPSLLEASR